jgi:hypothetical protein
MSKKILTELQRQCRQALQDKQESSDHARGIRTMAMLFADILNEEGKTSLADIMDSLSV